MMRMAVRPIAVSGSAADSPDMLFLILLTIWYRIDCTTSTSVMTDAEMGASFPAVSWLQCCSLMNGYVQALLNPIFVYKVATQLLQRTDYLRSTICRLDCSGACLQAFFMLQGSLDDDRRPS